MKRLVPIFCLFAFVAMACGREGSVVPIVSIGPSPTAAVTYEPYTTPSPSAEATAEPTAAPTAPTDTTAPTASPAATTAPTAAPTAAPATHTPTTHPDTPTNKPPDAYLKHAGQELKGEVTSYNWQTSSSHRTAFTDNTPDPSDSITIDRSGQLTISFTRGDSPNNNTGARYRTDPSKNAQTHAIVIANGNPAFIRAADLPTGTVWLDVFTYWPQGDVEHTFKLNVT
jgi:hypothetical protein